MNLLKNAAAPLVIPLRRGRGSLGIDGDLDSVLRTLDVLAGGFAAARFQAQGARVVELGPGRTPELTGALVLAGAANALGVDLVVQVPADSNSAERYARLAGALSDERGQCFLKSVGSSPSEVPTRYQELKRAIWPTQFKPYSDTRLPVPDAAADLVFSKSVLEHVAPRAVRPLVQEMYRVLAPGGVAVHLVDLRDHLHIVGDEEVKGDWLEVLHYPEPLFRAMFSNRSTAINRLRAPEWRVILEDAGFKIEGWSERKFPLPSGFDRSKLRSRWRSMSEDTLSIGYICFAARKVP